MVDGEAVTDWLKSWGRDEDGEGDATVEWQWFARSAVSESGDTILIPSLRRSVG